MGSVDVVIDKGALSKEAAKKYKKYMQELGFSCKGYLLDGIELEDYYFDDRRGEFVLNFRKSGVSECEDVTVTVRLDLMDIIDLLLSNPYILSKLASHKNKIEKVMDVLSSL